MTDLQDLPGVGAKTYDKLVEGGYDDLMTLATANASNIATICDIGEGTAAKIITAARDSLDMGFISGNEILERRKSVKKITTGSKELDTLIGGGIETQVITEFYGKFSSSKTQIAHQLAVNVQLPISKGGMNKNALYIDTENCFRPERIKQMAKALGLNAQQTLDNIYVGRSFNSNHQIVLAEKAKEIIKEKNIGIIIVDSVMAHFRSDYVGRGTLSDRQQKLNKHLHELQRLADTYNLAVYITNQVMASPNVAFGDPIRPVGGEILAHTSQFRVYIRKSKANLRVAKLVDSPYLPEGEAVYQVTSKGIEDSTTKPPKFPKKKKEDD